MINPDTQAGVYDWTIGGQDQLAQEWWWVQVGGQRFSVDALGPAVVTMPAANKATASYTDALNGYSIDISFELTGTDMASAQSLLKESVVIWNNSNSDLDISLFLYSDFDLGGTAGGDSASLQGMNDSVFPFGSTVGWYGAAQSDGAYEHSVIFNGKPLLAELAPFNSLLTKLNSTLDPLALDAGVVLPATSGSTTLAEYGPDGPGDMTYAIQWDYTIAAGGSAGVGVDKRLTPEPSTLALGFAGLLGLGLLRRRR